MLIPVARPLASSPPAPYSAAAIAKMKITAVLLVALVAVVAAEAPHRGLGRRLVATPPPAA